jgi:citrate lyase subunit beta/citryl-CoA lyase
MMKARHDGQMRSWLYPSLGDSDRVWLIKAAIWWRRHPHLRPRHLVAGSQKDLARKMVADPSPAGRDWSLWAWVNPLDGGLTSNDLDAVIRPGLAGILLPKRRP